MGVTIKPGAVPILLQQSLIASATCTRVSSTQDGIQKGLGDLGLGAQRRGAEKNVVAP